MNNFSLVSPVTDQFSALRNVPSGGAATIAVGVPTKAVDATAASPYLGTIAVMVDGDGTTSQRFSGIAKDTSTDTASAAGTVNTWLPLPGMIYQGSPKSTTAVDTLAELVTFFGKRVVFDLTTGTWTVDTAAADAATNCVTIVPGGEWQVPTVWFTVSTIGSMLQ